MKFNFTVIVGPKGQTSFTFRMKTKNVTLVADSLAKAPVSQTWYEYADQSYLDQHELKSSSPTVKLNTDLSLFDTGVTLQRKGSGIWMIRGEDDLVWADLRSFILEARRLARGLTN